MSLPDGTVCIMLDLHSDDAPRWDTTMREGFLSFAAVPYPPGTRSFVFYFAPGAWYQEFDWDGSRWRLVATGVQMITASGELIRAFEWNESAGTRDMPLRRLTMTEDLNNPTQAPF